MRLCVVLTNVVNCLRYAGLGASVCIAVRVVNEGVERPNRTPSVTSTYRSRSKSSGRRDAALDRVRRRAAPRVSTATLADAVHVSAIETPTVPRMKNARQVRPVFVPQNIHLFGRGAPRFACNKHALQFMRQPTSVPAASRLVPSCQHSEEP